MRGFSPRFVCLSISVTDSHQRSDFCECFPTAYLQRRYRSGVQNFSDVPGKPDAQHRYHYYLTPTAGPKLAFKEPALAELARVIEAGACIEASFKRGKGEVGMDEYQVRTWQGWHHHMTLSLLA